MLLELGAPTVEDTRAIGAALAPFLKPGDAVALTGELGAGKTTLVQGVARGLGVTEAVVSPTFTLVREYHGRLTLYHADVYRLDRVQDVLDLGFEEMTDDGALLVEWGDAVEGLLPADHLSIELTVPGGDERRRLVLTGVGGSWATRWERLEQTLERWGSAA
ncbi:MAG TPA: tRNA (adenosine(37)-N6)-threonylcarbamoyltransferase complex ATPase subunit type 1 TsaE [Actinomycetota bacterium]|nr:tRNA (adenosine(37)-N6)-threonylcarbamoyltransferase complex ATPase subunit type 1 TsaE [Actinomycetota bacterium]